MGVEQLLLVLPPHRAEIGADLTVHQWSSIVEQFVEQGGSEILLGGAEPLAFPGFWPLARLRRGSVRMTALLSGSLLEPWVVRELVESQLHFLVSLDSPWPEAHEAVRLPGSHTRALGAIETLLGHGVASRVGILATATRLNHDCLPDLAAWVANRGLARMVWTFVPEDGWPSVQLNTLRLSAAEVASLERDMGEASRAVSGRCYVGPLDSVSDSLLGAGFTRLLRVTARGEAVWGFSANGACLGNLRRARLKDLLARAAQAAGD